MNRIFKVKPLIAQPKSNQLGARQHLIRRAGSLYILSGGFEADAKDDRDFIVGFARCDEPQALNLAAA